MAIPRVFVSSTCYDLRYIRENLKYFIKTLGYDPVLSEEGSVYFDPSLDVQEACLSEVPNCQMFVLIIGGRFGGQYKDTEKSIVNAEYEEAVRLKIPVFALVEEAVYAEHRVFLENRDNPEIDESKIMYPAAESTKIFDFINEVRRNSVNNALMPFRDFADMELYLRQQWAGMMFSFLSRTNEDRRVADTLSWLAVMSDRIEFLSGQILASVGTDAAKVTAELYEFMLGRESVKGLISLGYKPDPKTILANDDFEGCAKALGKPLMVLDDVDFVTSGVGEIERNHLKYLSKDYADLRGQMIKLVAARGIDLNSLITGQ